MKNLITKAGRALFGETKSFDPSRRGVLKGAAALAATAVVATATPGVFKAMDAFAIDDLASQLKNGGVIMNQTFYVNDTVTLQNIRNLKIINCNFILSKFAPEESPFLRFGDGCENLWIKGCHFKRGELAS